VAIRAKRRHEHGVHAITVVAPDSTLVAPVESYDPDAFLAPIRMRVDDVLPLGESRGHWVLDKVLGVGMDTVLVQIYAVLEDADLHKRMEE
jgi:hypothetical protein